MCLCQFRLYYKVPQTRWLKHLTFILKVLGVRKSKIEMIADSVISEDSLPGLQTAVFLLYPHIVERGNFSVSSSSYKSTDSILGASHL